MKINLKISAMLTTFLAFATIAFISSSCAKKDESGRQPEGPKVSFKATGLTITDGKIEVGITKDSTLVVTYTVEAPGKIKKLDQTVGKTSETAAAANNQVSFSKDITLNLPLKDSSYVIKVEVKDVNDKSAALSVTINVVAFLPPANPLTAVQTITMGGPKSLSHTSRWDLDIPAGYGGFSLAATGANADKIPHMDSFYSMLSLNDTDTEGGHARFSNTGTKFLITDFTKAQFDAMENDRLLEELVIDKSFIEDIAVGKVIAFETNTGRIGLLYFDKYVEEGDDATFLFKIQKL